MKSYTYRDSRRQKLTDAIAVLSEEQADLRLALETELAILQTDTWEVTDETYKAVAADWIWQNFILIKALINQDPVLVALGVSTILTDVQVSAISLVSVPHLTANPPGDYLEKVLGAVDGDEKVLTEIVEAAHHIWLKNGIDAVIYPFDEVGVMLPVRLETLFDAPVSEQNDDPTRWKLSIRVVPDEASICRDSEFISSDEEKSLLTFWQSVRQPGGVSDTWLAGDVANIAWKRLTSHIRPERAAWLVSKVEVLVEDEQIVLNLPADMPEFPQPNRVGGIPPELKIFAVTAGLIAGTDHHLVGRLPKDENLKIDNSKLTLELLSKNEDPKKSWLTNWEAARSLGMGDEFHLPEGINPGNIKALYVIGIGDETPDAHFAAQSGSGELSIIRLGDATNSIQGKESGTPIDWQKVGQARVKNKLNPSPDPDTPGSRLQLHFTGNSNSIPFFPGADAQDDTQLSQRLVKALWPGLWGHSLHEIWRLGDAAYRRAHWAFEHLCPEGPLMPVRISDQPYGILPVTSLELWETPMAVDPETAAQSNEEMRIVKSMNSIRTRLADAGHDKRNVVGKTSSQFLELLGQDATSQYFMKRPFISGEVHKALFRLDAAQRDRFTEISLASYKSAIDVMGGNLPDDIYVSQSDPSFVGLPLVRPNYLLYKHVNGDRREHFPLSDLIVLLFGFDQNEPMTDYSLDSLFSRFNVLRNQVADFRLASLPDSLLIRLLVYATQNAYESLRNDIHNVSLSQLTVAHVKEAVTIAKELEPEAWVEKEEEPVKKELRFKLNIPDPVLKQWERAFSATLDTAANRIDPWVTGFAWQRLKEHSSSSRHIHRMGVYGWLDGPFIGTPGPTQAGLLHTPSYSQTLAALIMRDKFLSSTRTAVVNQSGENIWKMNITSQKVRLAEEIAEEVRLGFSFYEIVGRHVENIVAHPQKIRELRLKYPMRDERTDRHEVCEGKKALDGLLAGDANFPMGGDQTKSLNQLKDALDTYSDLLMGDGVMQLINRQTDRAAETMDAAAGNSRPPSFEFIRTPPSGYQLESIVLSALPFVSVDEIVGNLNPIRLADPSVAAFLENKMGNNWSWTAINEDDGTILGVADLAMIGLSAIDTLAMSDDDLKEMVRYKLNLPIAFVTKSGNRQWSAFDAADNLLGTATLATLKLDPDNMTGQDEIAASVRNKLAVPADSVIKETVPDDLQLWVVKNEYNEVLGLADKSNLGEIPDKEEEINQAVRQFSGIPKVRIDAPREHQLAQQLVAALGSRPASGRDLGENKKSPPTVDTGIYGEMLQRYASIYNIALALVPKLRTEDDADLAAAIREALPWGIVPISDPADKKAWMTAILGVELREGATPLTVLAENVAVALENRLKNSFHPDDMIGQDKIGAPIGNHNDLKVQGKPDGVPSLARAIANLASPNARLVILAGWNIDGIVANTRLVTAQSENIEEEWLTVTASVRSNLARLEALQLELADSLVSWTNSPNDPWRTAAVSENLSIRNTESVVKMKMERFVAAYGPAETWASEKIAAGLIDSFNEAIPMPQRKTSAAFGFNAPAARAQQAILLAVPPKPRQRLDTNLLFKIVEETRTLAQGRMTRSEDLDDLQLLSSAMWLKAFGPTRVWLESGPLFTQ
ncbi:hypothetical protein [Dyadobacter sp. NIV53]|uniref:hypothetical protein n=1 Tax=Dyadobacter sp. NIV53 TaxID=2861765 RepID=UPI001C87AF85|nr:hypothetical protein [Dyadobacter sp. NIV53]